MTGKERIMRTFRGEEVDRPVLKLWGFDPDVPLLHPAYAPCAQAAYEKTDWFLGAGSPFDPLVGSNQSLYSVVRKPTQNPEWVDVTTVLHTPLGDLTRLFRESTVGKPGYILRHFVQDEQDLRKVLALPYQPMEPDVKRYINRKKRVGDRGVAMFGVGQPGYILQELTGSELLGYLAVDEEELVLEVARTFARRRDEAFERAWEAGLKEDTDGLLVSWVGHELVTPPLMSPAWFEKLAFELDQPLMTRVHERGGYNWDHTHGRVGKLLHRFADMGVDVLNPIEPPPMGDITLADALKKIDGRMALEGNIEIGEIMSAPKERMQYLIEEAVQAGLPYAGRFILCPSAGYMENPFPDEGFIDNILRYINESFRLLQASKQ